MRFSEPTRTPNTRALVVLVALDVLVVSALCAAPATRPTTTPATRPVYPPPELVRACAAAEAKATARIDDASFHSVLRPPFVVIGNLPPSSLARVADGSVVRPAEAMWRSYFTRRPTDPILVYLFRDEASYRPWAKKLFDDDDVPHFGYYRHADRTMVMNIATGTGTLVHELTHALIAYDFPNVPTWFNEGLGSLHEQCTVQPDVIVGLANWRLPALQKALADGECGPLEELVSRGDFYGPRRGLNYAQARYFVMYMQQQGVLKKFYHHYRARHPKGDTAVQAIEAVFGKPLKTVEAECTKWVKTLSFPAR